MNGALQMSRRTSNTTSPHKNHLKFKHVPIHDPEPWKPVQFIIAAYPNGGGLTTDGEAGEWDCANAGEVFDHLFWLHDRGFVIYSMLSSQKLAEATAPRMWAVHYWNRRPTHYVAAFNIKVYPFAAYDDVESVWPFFEWLRELGVSAGSFSSMGRKTWLRTLPDTVDFYDRGNNGRLTIYGGRREATRGRYVHMRYHDLNSAYPSTMASLDIPTMVLEMRPGFYDTGYALATVRIPSDLPWGPLPCRLGKYAVTYGHGEQTDWWQFEDLRQVEESGGQVIIHRSFMGARHKPVFRNWYEYVVMPARMSLTGDSLKISKTIFNRLWSSFSLGGLSQVKRWHDPLGVQVIERSSETLGLSRKAYVSAMVAAHVRTRLLNGMNRATDVVYADTDGIVSSDTQSLGDGWGIKREMPMVEIHSPSNFKWECPLCGVGHVGPHYNIGIACKDRKYAEHLLKQDAAPTNPLVGQAVPADDLKTLRMKFGYIEPEITAREVFPWDTNRKGTQPRIPVGRQ